MEEREKKEMKRAMNFRREFLKIIFAFKIVKKKAIIIFNKLGNFIIDSSRFSHDRPIKR